jgi:hypothetical protein
LINLSTYHVYACQIYTYIYIEIYTYYTISIYLHIYIYIYTCILRHFYDSYNSVFISCLYPFDLGVIFLTVLTTGSPLPPFRTHIHYPVTRSLKSKP